MTLREAFESQSRACANLGSPFMGRLMALAAQNLTPQTKPGAFLLSFESDDPGPSGDSLPLRLAGALHRLVLSGDAPDLARHYPPHETTDLALWSAVEQAMATHGDQLVSHLHSPPQTNELRRSVALIPALHTAVARFPLPVALSELGASAGLNLLADQFHLETSNTRFGPEQATVRLTPDWTGPAPSPVAIQVVERRGVDLRPFNLTQPGAENRLLGYLWPDQPERVTNSRAALQVMKDHPVQVDQGDAIDWLADRLATPMPGRLHVIYHTIAWQYFPKDSQQRGEAIMEEAGARATSDAPIARISLEADNTAKGAALTLRLWPDGTRTELARVDFHGRWVEWLADA